MDNIHVGMEDIRMSNNIEQDNHSSFIIWLDSVLSGYEPKTLTKYTNNPDCQINTTTAVGATTVAYRLTRNYINYHNGSYIEVDWLDWTSKLF